ncbi:MAG: hypothetical protein ACRDLT_04075 [Solirubrobacteraceae bacterium]
MACSARPPGGLFTAPRAVATVADLFANVWQLGYVTSDLDRALAELAQRFGLEHQFRVPSGGATFMAGDEAVPWEARFAMAARGGLIVEVIEPVAGEVGFYRDALPADGSFAIRLHHLAAFMETGDEAWARAGQMLEQAGLRFDYTMLIPGRVRAGYIDARAELGHFLELCQLDARDLEFFNALVFESA